MKWVVIVAGLGLVAWGGYLHWSGWFIVQIERGWSGVIAGAVLIGAGTVMLAVAALMVQIERLARALAPSGKAVHVAPSPPPSKNDGERASPRSSDGAAAPAPTAAASAAPAARPEARAPQQSQPLTANRNDGPVRPPAEARRAPAPRPAAASAPPEDESRANGWLQRAVTEPAPSRPSAGSTPPLPSAPEEERAPPKVTRRYEAQGVQYTLYDDGSIDAESRGGRYHFASITQLRDHLERGKG